MLLATELSAYQGACETLTPQFKIKLHLLLMNLTGY